MKKAKTTLSDLKMALFGLGYIFNRVYKIYTFIDAPLLTVGWLIKKIKDYYQAQ
mgnify:CR=1 FL=1